MFAPLSTIGRRSLIGYLVAVCVVSLSTSLVQIEGRKCVCTSKACKEAGVDTCRTKFFCYTEFLLTTERETGANTTTRGCTESATPLLCETKSRVAGPRSTAPNNAVTSPWVLGVSWPRLKCCHSHDYCNADDDADLGERKAMDLARSAAAEPETTEDASAGRDAITPIARPSDRKGEDPPASDRQLRDQVRALQVAALVLAFAALISVLASCYVITRFLRSDRYAMTGVAN